MMVDGRTVRNLRSDTNTMGVKDGLRWVRSVGYDGGSLGLMVEG